MEWAELAVIDLSKARSPEARVDIAGQARDAMRNVGFFYVINHGYTPPEVRKRIHIFSNIFQCLHRPNEYLTSQTFLFRMRQTKRNYGM